MTYGLAPGSSAVGSASVTMRLAAGNSSGEAIGSMRVTAKPLAAPSSTSAPAIGVVPTTHSAGAGSCGST